MCTSDLSKARCGNRSQTSKHFGGLTGHTTGISNFILCVSGVLKPLAKGKYQDFTVMCLSWGFLCVMCFTHTATSQQRKNKRKGRTYIKWIIIAFYWGGYHEAGRPNSAARCRDLGIAVSALIQLILLQVGKCKHLPVLSQIKRYDQSCDANYFIPVELGSNLVWRGTDGGVLLRSTAAALSIRQTTGSQQSPHLLFFN